VAPVPPSRIFGGAAAQHEEEAAPIRRNALIEDPANDPILSPSADEVKLRRSEVVVLGKLDERDFRIHA
jgi:hypothetical protein